MKIFEQLGVALLAGAIIKIAYDHAHPAAKTGTLAINTDKTGAGGDWVGMAPDNTVKVVNSLDTPYNTTVTNDPGIITPFVDYADGEI